MRGRCGTVSVSHRKSIFGKWGLPIFGIYHIKEIWVPDSNLSFNITYLLSLCSSYNGHITDYPKSERFKTILLYSQIVKDRNSEKKQRGWLISVHNAWELSQEDWEAGLTPGGRLESFICVWDASAPITQRLGILMGLAHLRVASLCGLASSHPRHLREADAIQGSSGFQAWVFQRARWRLHVFLWHTLRVTWHHFCQTSLVEIRIHFLMVKL